ncbi:glycosyltransferase involved in cell wall biosynthesis [Chromohalobacter marismortui]|uniref:Glycosyltransferase involved in cell wall biosynthesis n=1 Tax=Chromohalobacter marismortui TaxID=42055 RepID=A0A4R7NVH2_9GAMM|nr:MULTISPECIES: glycosyltransferase [Chromohalobacter]MCI0511148.1 glycosyltransferase [Chromohalobacter sp.]MCI0594564.1 glycosyltransferase [Chromohalobacter sp.]TDU25173.1 glycosyltransferase involved in cell wall biosynthesis [Chromohalobacter marismortui]
MDSLQRMSTAESPLSKTNGVGIALFLPSLEGGGAEMVMVTLANGLAAQGWQVDLVVAHAIGAYVKNVSTAVRLIDLRAARVLYSIPALVRYLRRERPPVLLSALNYANVVALWASRLASVGTRVVISEHNDVTRDMGSEPVGRSWLIPLLMRQSYPRANGIVAVSGGVADALSKALSLPRERIDVIYNPAVTERLRELSRVTVTHPWLAPGEPPVILAVGRLTAQKDYPTLLKAFAALRAQREARLVILGEGELRGALEAMATDLQLSDDVAFLGFVDNPYAWMRQASLFVLSSRWEGFGNVLAEAMACGTPVISTDCPSGPAEILEHGAWGRLVPMGDPVALCESMAASLSGDCHPEVERRAQAFDLGQAVQAYIRVVQRQSI